MPALFLSEGNQRVERECFHLPGAAIVQRLLQDRKVEILWSKVPTFCPSRCQPCLSAAGPGQEIPASTHHDGF